MNEHLPIYIPKPRVCREHQHQNNKHCAACRLNLICSQIQTQTVCKKDCPSCTYNGCSLTDQQRRTTPVYVSGIIQGERTFIDLKGKYWREQQEHRKKHKKLYYIYNCLWGNTLEKNRTRSKARYDADPEYWRMKAAEYYRRKHPQQSEDPIPVGATLPECGLNCDCCPYPDCTLPDDWREKEINRIRNRRFYKNNREKLLEKQKERRSRPEVKAQRAEWDKQYRKKHPEKDREKQRRYREKHPEKVREITRAYYQKNKYTINAKRRAKRAAEISASA